jgi:hypothetical protein
VIAGWKCRNLHRDLLGLDVKPKEPVQWSMQQALRPPASDQRQLNAMKATHASPVTFLIGFEQVPEDKFRDQEESYWQLQC